ncbi:hypothetical protein TRIUR3_00848 [Triticum urartu]|uniref:Uncharacterized protein n=1 Tax=Triticum urartu TaxID=4572 RepID=M7Z574_TRIUA|nr:hypothetical protein TRIUR3_00848 [Triticum urartu]
MGGLPWWLAPTECTPQPSSSGSLAGTLAFIFLSPCPQRALLGAIDLLFLLASLLLVLAKRRGSGRAGPEHEALLPTPTAPSRSITCGYAVALGASAVLAAASAVLLAIAAFLLPPAAWRYAESAFLAAHCAAHAVAAWTVVAASRKPAAAHPPRHLRVFWIATALCAALFSASAAIRCAGGSPLFKATSSISNMF